MRVSDHRYEIFVRLGNVDRLIDALRIRIAHERVLISGHRKQQRLCRIFLRSASGMLIGDSVIPGSTDITARTRGRFDSLASAATLRQQSAHRVAHHGKLVQVRFDVAALRLQPVIARL